MNDERIEVHNPMERKILVEVEGTQVALKPDQTLYVKR